MVEFLENVLVLSSKQKLLYSRQSLAERNEFLIKKANSL